MNNGTVKLSFTYIKLGIFLKDYDYEQAFLSNLWFLEITRLNCYGCVYCDAFKGYLLWESLKDNVMMFENISGYFKVSFIRNWGIGGDLKN